MSIFLAFLTGGAICVIGQLLIDKTNLTPARILTSFVVAGVILGALGLYQPLTDFGQEGAAVPICGFGSLMAQGVRDALRRDGALGILRRCSFPFARRCSQNHGINNHGLAIADEI